MYVTILDIRAYFHLKPKMNLGIVSQQIFVILSLLTDSALFSLCIK